MNEISAADFERLENKVDKLGDSLNKLVLVEERQTNQGIRLGEVEQKIAVVFTKLELVDRKVDQWINRGVGVWAVAVTLWAVVELAISRGFIK